MNIREFWKKKSFILLNKLKDFLEKLKGESCKKLSKKAWHLCPCKNEGVYALVNRYFGLGYSWQLVVGGGCQATSTLASLQLAIAGLSGTSPTLPSLVE